MNRNVVRIAVFSAACIALCMVTGISKAEQSEDGLWAFQDGNAAPSASAQAWAAPNLYRTVELDTAALDTDLATAGTEGPNVDVKTAGAEIMLPLPDGTFQSFVVVERLLMSPSLASTNPSLTTWRGVGLDDSEATVTCTRSALGFQCMIRRPAGTVYIDPLYRGNDSLHAVYDYRTNMHGTAFGCLCEDAATSFGSGAGAGAGGPAGLVSSGAQRHEFRLAVACTGEYFQFWGTNPATVAGITATVNNVTAVMENDVTVRMNLVATVINTDPTTDLYDRVGSLNGQVQSDLDTNVGDANYDIGHLFDSFGGSISGNAGCIGCICTSGSKGSGWSDGGPIPTGGTMDFLVLHEMGHQLGGRHTFAGSGCNPGSYDQPSSVEPGSGSTIMSYSSICGADNVLGGAVGDLYYHADSIDRIVTVTAAAPCRSDVATGNSAPSVSAGADFTIPQGTPFTLFATGSDPDSDPLTFCWEQMDPSDMSYPLTQVDNGQNPLFRSYPPTINPLRIFPELTDLLAGNLFPGTLGEQLPTTNRTMTFWVTARDNVPNGGGIDQDSMSLTVDASTGPFAVLTPNGGEVVPVDVPYEITWDVAGTTGGAVNMANVQIQLWDNGGLSQVGLIAASTPNDGSYFHTFTCADLATDLRIRVVSAMAGHSFFDYSDDDFEVADVTPPTVICNVARPLLWPARRGMLPIGLTWAQLPDSCDPNPTRTLSIYSTEADGAAPFSPDWMFTAPSSLWLRAERAYPGPGRVYMVVINAVDASGNRGADCCSVIVPAFPVGSQIMMLRATAMAAEAACIASPTDTAPPGFVPLVQGVPLP